MIRDTEKKIHKEFQNLAFMGDAFPMLTEWGVEDFSLLIHSLGCNYLSALGREFNFWAMSEYPVRIKTGESRSIRPDTVWWKKPDKEVILLGEFERFEPSHKQKIIAKARNLIKAHYEIGDGPRILLLMIWAMAGTDLGFLSTIKAMANEGFRDNGVLIPGIGPSTVFMVGASVFVNSNGSHRLQRIYI